MLARGLPVLLCSECRCGFPVRMQLLLTLVSFYLYLALSSRWMGFHGLNYCDFRARRALG
jgi:hypothetical protein